MIRKNSNNCDNNNKNDNKITDNQNNDCDETKILITPISKLTTTRIAVPIR